MTATIILDKSSTSWSSLSSKSANQAPAASTYIASPSGYGDEGKWSWMARISGEAKNRLIQEGYMNPATAWTDETTFGAADNQTGKMGME